MNSELLKEVALRRSKSAPDALFTQFRLDLTPVDTPFLTEDQEKACAANFRAWYQAQNGLNNGTLSPKERLRLQKIVSENIEGAHRLILTNARLVVGEALKAVNSRPENAPDIDLLDVIQETIIHGLFPAAERFHPDKGPFHPYLKQSARRAARRATVTQAQGTITTVHASRVNSRIAGMRDEFLQENHRDPTPQEIARELKSDEATITKALHGRTIPLDSLEGSNEEENDHSYRHLVDGSPDFTNLYRPIEQEIETREEREERKLMIENALHSAGLTAEEAKVLRLRHFSQEKPLSFSQIASQIGWSCYKTAKRRYESASLKLRFALENRN